MHEANRLNWDDGKWKNNYWEKISNGLKFIVGWYRFVYWKHQSISSIFETQGESYFRDCETNALQQLINHPGVISTGGGIIVRQENRQLLTEHTLVIFLETEITTLIKRLDINNRPLLQNEIIETKLTSLYKARENFYRDCAHITVKTDHLTVAEVVEQIKNQMNQ